MMAQDTRLYMLKDLSVTCAHCGTTVLREVQKGVDLGIATLIVRMAAQGAYDRVMLCAGDGDFEDAISSVKSERLQSHADTVIWLEDLHPAIDRQG